MVVHFPFGRTTCGPESESRCFSLTVAILRIGCAALGATHTRHHIDCTHPGCNAVDA